MLNWQGDPTQSGDEQSREQPKTKEKTKRGGPRPKRASPPDRVPQDPAMEREDHPEHDVLIFPRREKLKTQAEFIRVPARAAAEPAAAQALPDEHTGPYRSKSEAWTLLDFGARRALSAARPALVRTDADIPHVGAADQPEKRAGIGPGFAILPVKPEPSAASFITCYVINIENLAGRNFWTVEEWSDSKQKIDFKAPVHPKEFQALIAGPWGKVYRLKVCNDELWPSEPIHVKVGDHIIAELEDVDLRTEPQIWSQLRNGTVAGRTWFRRDGTTVPLVNITALQAELPFDENEKNKKENEG